MTEWAQYILNQMEVSGHPGLYVLGCGAQRVTVLSQQFRAFNLIWALIADGRLKAGDQIGVVGGGIGGLTVAAAAMTVGCKVVIVEERPELMHLQRQNKTRFVHPNIYEWPQPVAAERSTKFPCMNWTADWAGQIVAALDDEWDKLQAKFKPIVKLNTEITGFDTIDGRRVMTSDDWESTPCALVVLAVGFGVEQATPGLRLETYWDNDNLDQPVHGLQSLKRFFVSGLGDGACIDVLRLSYSKFDHDTFVNKIVRLDRLTSLSAKLIEIDLHMPSADQARYIRTEYEKLAFPADLAQSLGTLRVDTYVELNGSEPYPYSPKACILHRVALWGLDMAGCLNYRPGKINPTQIATRSAPTGVKYMVPDSAGGGSSAFDGVVLRHGSRSRLQMFSTLSTCYRGITDNPANDRTRGQLYPDDFYSITSVAHTVDSSVIAVTPSGPIKDSREFVRGTIPPKIVESVMEAAVAGGNIEAKQPISLAASQIEFLTARVFSETLSQNFSDAKDAADQLEALLCQPLEALSDQLWWNANKSLFDFEMMAINRADGKMKNVGRLKELTERMDHGNS